jgi:trimeric autotransporter adhesin
VTYTLGAEVEHLTLTGSAAIGGTGNALSNTINGNAGNNSLDGGAGSDTLAGGAGDDRYVVDVATDVVSELGGAGLDTVVSQISWTLGDNLENLTLSGSSAVNGTGNTVNNVLTGNAANNTLTGNAGNDTLDGGAGTDQLLGGAGADIYVFGRGSGLDTVQDNDTTANVKDRVQFGAGIAKTDLRWLRSGNNLEVAIGQTADKIVVKDWYLGTRYRVEEFRLADGSIVTESQVQSLVSAMAAFSAHAAAPTPTMQAASQPMHGQLLLNPVM